MDNFDKFYKIFSDFTTKFNHKNSYLKERILHILYFAREHLSATDIQREFKLKHKEDISLTSIYDLLNFLNDCELSNSYEENGIRKYELNLKRHHDHMICEKCQKVVTFYDEIIEDRQYKISKNSNFILKAHTMILYGICADCQNIDDNDTQKALSSV